MNCCDPCPPCQPSLPIDCEPLPLTTDAKRLVVEDEASCKKTLETNPSPHILLSTSAGNVEWQGGSTGSLMQYSIAGNIEFANASNAEPVKLPLMSTHTTDNVPDVIVMLADGTVKKWDPSNVGNNFLAYWDGGYWRINTLNSLLPAGNGLIIRNSTGDLAVVPNGVNGSSLQMVGTNIQFVSAPANQLPGGHLYGLTLSNSITSLNNDISVSTGECRSASNTQDIFLTSVIVKQLNNIFASGTNAGGIVDAVTKQANSTYHAFVITDGVSVDVCFSTSIIPTGQPNYPAGFTQYRRIGAVTTDGSSNIRQFSQFGDRFLYTGKPIADASGASIATGRTLVTLTVPSGIKVFPIINSFDFTNNYQLFYDPDSTWPPTLTPNSINTGSNILMQKNGGYSGFSALNGFMTNTVRQIGVDTSANSTTFYLDTYGWIDQRGRLQP